MTDTRENQLLATSDPFMQQLSVIDVYDPILRSPDDERWCFDVSENGNLI